MSPISAHEAATVGVHEPASPTLGPQSTSSALAHELRVTLGRVVRRIRAEPGPSAGRTAVLGRLDRDGPSSISDLAARERMRPQSMAQTVHDLETAGIVSRRPDPGDGRRAFVEMTAAGLELLQSTRARRETWLTETLERELDADERALLHKALALLSRVADA
ncbi:MAG: MarR family winged helix-turn-helix transcriptional regulator [Solirubrobacteraceae bacterium]